MTSHPAIDGVTLPDVAGLVLRPYRGLDDDLPGMWAANVAARRAAGELEPIVYEGMRAQYDHLVRSDSATDILVVELDGATVGYARVEWADSNDGGRWYESICILHPDALRRGIGRAMLDWTERRRRAIAADQRARGETGDRPLWLTAETFDGDPGGRALLTAVGYEPVRHFYSMRRPTLDDVPDLPLPDGLEVRPIPADRAVMRAVFDADAEAFRDHFGWVDEGDEAFLAFVEDPDTDPDLWVVAYDGDEVAGAVLNGIHAEDDAAPEGWLDSIFTRRAWRRRGLARALIARSLAVLRDRGLSAANLGVDAANENEALRLYESVGFELRSSSTYHRKPLDETPSGPKETDR